MKNQCTGFIKVPLNKYQQESETLSKSSLINYKISELQKYNKAKNELYPDWKNGAITRDEFYSLKQSLGERINALKQEIVIIKKEQSVDCYKQKGPDINKSFLLQSVNSLTRQFLISLVEKIYIYDGKHIKIIVKY